MKSTCTVADPDTGWDRVATAAGSGDDGPLLPTVRKPRPPSEPLPRPGSRLDDDALRAGIVTAYYTARAAGDWAAELAALADATRYDTAHPGESLADELCVDLRGVAA